MAGAIGHPAIDRYLEMVEDTESPRLFHVWCFLSGISACLGRRVWLPFGESKVWGNQFVLLVGPPAARKSTAINIAVKCVKKATKVRFAPDDTSGQRQGLIKHMMGDDLEGEEGKLLEAKMSTAVDVAGIEDTLSTIEITDTRDAHVTYIAASEFTSFMGHGNTELITFLGKMWDGEDYQYQLKNSNDWLRDPLVNLIGGSTPTNIASAFPPEAIGQGFTSRLILVYSNTKYKSIPRPPKFDEKLKAEIEDIFRYAFYQASGPMEETKEAWGVFNDLYEYDPKIKDPRFTYYVGRRHTHLQKIAMALAVARRSMTIDKCDVETAHRLLTYTENYMPEALGEFGMSPLGAAKQKLLEYLAMSKAPIPLTGIWAVMHRDMKMVDFQNTLAELVNAGRVKRLLAPDQTPLFIYVNTSEKLPADAGAKLFESPAMKRKSAAE